MSTITARRTPFSRQQKNQVDGSGGSNRGEDDSRGPVYALDDFVPDQINCPVDLLKLDVQGYELMVLQGAAGLLGRAAFPLIYLEICYVPQYRDQTCLSDLYSLLYGCGYRLVSAYPSEFDARGHKYRLSGDLLFVHESYGSASPSHLSKRDD